MLAIRLIITIFLMNAFTLHHPLMSEYSAKVAGIGLGFWFGMEIVLEITKREKKQKEQAHE